MLKLITSPLASPRVLVFLVIGFFVAFGLHHIGHFVTADEHYWVEERVPRYFKAWGDFDLRRTFINDKPGVALALITGPALLWNEDTEKHCRELDNRLLDCKAEQTPFLYGSFRVLILLANGLLLLLLFSMLRRLTDDWIALFTVTLTALSPVLLGLSQIVNPDALLWSFSVVAVAAWLTLMKTSEWRFAFITLFALAFALLSKYTALILVPTFALASLAYFLLRRDTKRDSLPLLRLKQEMTWLIIVTGGAFTLLAAFVPALVVDRKYLTEFLMTVPDKERLIFWFAPLAAWFFADLFLLHGRSLRFLRSIAGHHFSWTRLLPLILISTFVGLVSVRYLLPDWSIFTKIAFDLKDLSDARYVTSIPNLFEAYVLNWNPIVFTLTPIALVGLAAAWWQGLRRPWHDYFFLPFFVGAFATFFTLILIRSNVLATPRYSIVLYPLLALAAGIGFHHIARHFHHFPRARLVLFGLILMTSILSLLTIRPFYFNYANTLLPDEALVADAWGYGGYEAAKYLNNLPDAENFTVWADYYGVCEFARFKCLTAYTFDPNQIKPDYYVLTRRGKIRYMPRFDRWEEKSGLIAYRYYEDPHPLWSLEIDQRPGNFVKVYKVNKDFQASIVTDIDHCPSRAGVAEEKLDAFLAFSRERKSDLVISLGDNASHRLRNCSATGDADTRYIAERLRSTGLPTHLVLGDHDIASSVASYQSWLSTIGRERTYYSFSTKGVRVVVLDTVLGGEPMRPACAEDPICSALEKRLSDSQNLPLAAYRAQYPDSLPSRSSERRRLAKALSQERSAIALVRSFGNRDRGRLSNQQLQWLRQDLSATPFRRVLILSDHPIFPFQTDRKRYDIVGSETILDILKSSEKDIVAVSGEAHLWHETVQENIRFFIVDEFRKANGSWASLTWDDRGPRFEKITH